MRDRQTSAPWSTWLPGHPGEGSMHIAVFAPLAWPGRGPQIWTAVPPDMDTGQLGLQANAMCEAAVAAGAIIYVGTATMPQLDLIVTTVQDRLGGYRRIPLERAFDPAAVWPLQEN